MSPDAIAKAPEDAKSLELLKQRGAAITTDGRGIDVSKARFADIQVVGDAKKIELKNNIYTPVSQGERIVTIIQTSRDMNGAEMYVLMLTTVPAEKKTESITTPKSEPLKANETLNTGEKENLASLVKHGSLPDKSPGDKQKLRLKYPEMELANNGKLSTEAMQEVLSNMSKDTNLAKVINSKFLEAVAKSTNPTFLRAILGTLLSLTSGTHASNNLGLRIGAENNPTTAIEVNKYLDTK